jgi:hypothetical protein
LREKPLLEMATQYFWLSSSKTGGTGDDFFKNTKFYAWRMPFLFFKMIKELIHFGSVVRSSVKMKFNRIGKRKNA